MILDEIPALATQAITLGKQLEDSGLYGWGKQLQQAHQLMDIQKLFSIMTQFSKFNPTK